MATKTMKVLVCDVCGAHETERYVVTFPGDGRRSIDLCAKHAKPLEDLRQLVGERGPGRRFQHPPVVPADVVKQAASKGKPARKKAAATKATASPKARTTKRR